MFGGGLNIIGDLTGGLKNAQLKGSVVLMRKNVLDFNDFGATVVDGITEFLGRGVTCQLISSTFVDSSESHPTPGGLLFFPGLNSDLYVLTHMHV